MTPEEAADRALATLRRQHEIAWQLTRYHLDGLSDEHLRWRPADRGLHVLPTADGAWRPDWPDHEGYDLGPSSIAWILWHMGFWWSMVLDHSFGTRTLTREAVTWPGSASGVQAWIDELHATWSARLAELDDADLAGDALTRWPLKERPFGDVVAWVNLELMKNAAELGYARFLYGA